MGTIYNFNKLQFLPWKCRDGDLEVSNFYLDKDGIPKSSQSHKETPHFSDFSIYKYETNHYYGKLEEYLKDGWVQNWLGTGYVVKDNVSIATSFFTYPRETRYMVARWVNINHDERTPDLQLVGSRLFELKEFDQLIFLQLAKTGQAYIEKILNEFKNEL